MHALTAKFGTLIFTQQFPEKEPNSAIRNVSVLERSQNTVLLVSTQAAYKALHSTVREQQSVRVIPSSGSATEAVQGSSA